MTDRLVVREAHRSERNHARGSQGLNAPGGAGCFPTRERHDCAIQRIRLNAPDGAGCFPTPRRVVRCPACGNGPRIATGPKAPLDRAAHRSLNQALSSSRKGRHRRACRGSEPPDVDAAMRIRGAVPCSSDTSVQARAVNREALARRPPGGCGRVVGEGRRRTRVARGFPPSSVRLARTVGTPLWAWCHVLDWVLGAWPLFLGASTPPSCRWCGLLARLLQAGQGGEHGDRVVDEASAGPGH